MKSSRPTYNLHYGKADGTFNDMEYVTLLKGSEFPAPWEFQYYYNSKSTIDKKVTFKMSMIDVLNDKSITKKGIDWKFDAKYDGSDPYGICSVESAASANCDNKVGPLRGIEPIDNLRNKFKLNILDYFISQNNNDERLGREAMAKAKELYISLDFQSDKRNATVPIVKDSAGAWQLADRRDVLWLTEQGVDTPIAPGEPFQYYGNGPKKISGKCRTVKDGVTRSKNVGMGNVKVVPCMMGPGVNAPLSLIDNIITTTEYYGNGKKHPGNAIDISADCGTPLVAQFDGVIVESYFPSGGTLAACKDNLDLNARCEGRLQVQYGNGIIVTYKHLLFGEVIKQVERTKTCQGIKSQIEKGEYKIKVSKDSWVRKNQTIGFIDSTGNSKGSHLHYSIRVKAMNGKKLRESEPSPLTFNWLKYRKCLEEFKQNKGDKKICKRH